MTNITVPSSDYVGLGDEFHRRADDLQKLTKSAPNQIRQLRGYGDYFKFFGGEIDRASEHGINYNASPGFSAYDVQKTLTWNVTSPANIGMTISTASGTTNCASEFMIEAEQQKPELKLFQNPPESFNSLGITEDTVEVLNQLKQGLGDTWRTAWDEISVESIKTAANNARTVFDELSWLKPYDHLKTLDWCKLDNKRGPTRATRYAWILHGDNLPEELNSKPSADPVWKPFKDAYDNLQKYVHTTIEIKKVDILYVETHLKSLQVGFEQYLREGFDRLKQT